MTIHKLKENRYAIYFGVLIFTLVLCSLITEFNLLDFSYIILIVICLIRYILVCKKEKE